MKRKIYHIIVDIDVYAEPVMSAKEFQPWFSDFVDSIIKYARSIGYKLLSPDPVVSKLNEGVSKYYTLIDRDADEVTKVILGLRFSNHDSKLSEEAHEDIIRSQNKQIVDQDNPKIKYLDVVQPDQPYVKISIGNSVFRDIDRAQQVLESKLLKIKQEGSTS